MRRCGFGRCHAGSRHRVGAHKSTGNTHHPFTLIMRDPITRGTGSTKCVCHPTEHPDGKRPFEDRPSRPLNRNRSVRQPWMPWIRVLVLAAILAGLPRPALAHRLSDSCLRLTLAPDGNAISGRLDIPLRDLAWVLPLDADGDNAL